MCCASMHSDLSWTGKHSITTSPKQTAYIVGLAILYISPCVCQEGSYFIRSEFTHRYSNNIVMGVEENIALSHPIKAQRKK